MLPVQSFLKRFRKIAKKTISFVMCVHLCVRVEQLGFHWRNFHEIRYFLIFRKSVENFKCYYNMIRIRGT